ncbi:hypothetical protein N7491_003641 [Penicillium cf. griseofulvum]|uniref:Uncharacterized protein n=1 Tax=Penicillium cf. griseofulvum TaxID=2972120 RepID=A0A9W9MQP2_9EURO|nr:hypothetical protein N7472_002182 [Penicillium cf. griseofulvum]KAJ5441235.1 hypothetical protein N7491_003641 [Penicillium cf. griseofulvum]
MEKPTVIGPNGLAPISIKEQADFKLTTKVIYDVISNYRMISLEESIHAPAAVRNTVRANRLASVNKLSAKMATRRSAELGDPDDLRILYDASNGIQKTKQLGNENKAAARVPAAARNPGIDPRAKPFVPAAVANKSVGPKDKVTHALQESAPRKSTTGLKKGAGLRRDIADNVSTQDIATKNKKAAGTPIKASAGSKDAGNDSTAGSKPSQETESIGDEESTSSPKKQRGLTAPADFMKQVRLLNLQKKMAPKVVPTGPPRRIVFGNLPEWANISGILHLVYGGVVECAWSENGEVIVQFVEQEDCIKYYENHSDGIRVNDGDDELTISVTMPEEGLQDHAELSKRVEEGASRVVCLSGLPTGFKSSDNEEILGIAADPAWGSKSFDHILIKQAESGVDVYILFYDLHGGWDFLQSIKEGAYDCIANFEVDPCARAEGFHFVDEPNQMLSNIIVE